MDVLGIKELNPKNVILIHNFFSDNFDEENLDYYSSYKRLQGNKTNFLTRIKYGNDGAISFIPVDASIKPGLRAYNFLGHLTEDDCINLERLIKCKYFKIKFSCM